MLKELIREKFSFYTKPLSKAISRVLYAMLFAKNANTFSIANTLCLLEKKDNVSFNTADKLICDFLKIQNSKLMKLFSDCFLALL